LPVTAPTLRVVILAPWGTRFGGAERRLLTLLQQIDRTRVDPRVIFLVDGPMVQEVSDAGITVSVLAAGRLRNLRAFGRVVRALRRDLQRRPADILLSWGSKAQLYGGLASIDNSELANVWWMLEIPTRTWLPMLATALPAHAVACSSQYVATEQRRLLVPRRRTLVVHPGVREPRHVRATELDELRGRLGIPRERLVVGTVGRMQPWKNHHLFVDAVARLVEEGLDIHGVIVGGTSHGRSPSYEAQLRDRAACAGLSDRISFVGHQRDVDQYFALFDVFVLGSGSEPFGLVVLEAMASGVPVIAVNRAGPAEILENERTGVLVEEASAAEFAAAITQLAQDPECRNRLRLAARAQYEMRFTESRMTRELEAALQLLVAG
jgi:glycosyltransferase involved in cell wall biosynthesis